MAPVILELRRRPAFEPIVCLTAQHRSLLDEPLGLFQIRADVDLDLMQADQDPVGLAGRALVQLRRVLADTRPDVVLVQGDTTTAFCGAFAAFHQRVPVGHVEAGLRTGRRDEPFPEELNRVLIGRIAQFHFAPTASARRALLREQVEDLSIYVTGNPVVDAVQQVAALPEPPDLPVQIAPGRRMILLTSHRREHHGELQRAMLHAILAVLEELPDVELVFPVHPNPQVRAATDAVLKGKARVHLLPPLPYRTFVALLQRAALVLTDSGGVQEEAPSLRVPVVVLRDATERGEGLAAGVGVLAGSDPAKIREVTLALLKDPARLERMRATANPYGDGRAGARICDILEARLLAT